MPTAAVQSEPLARALAPWAIQRCGSRCGCASCGHGHAEEDLLDERTGAGLLRSAVQRRSA